ncbi:glycosyltransferase [Candidatus Viridilinea mediisalina]|uniref:Glycosyltransferase subfamily 4-like N-terminal domain-containing protein n=1 Tax=Candidatus Viridilinea mediisalina TaxID=2024553 RepID=A0A2A6RKZ6_9CHLR|nr:glycosyltransferase [Candidatus Viridilinea mediisalina]PDW03603.1 hypothetical protein CJ255_08005 [Candidatus Viridilinea mediisalina]
MTMTKICHLTSVHPPFDTRIFHKECRTLADAGYDVVLIAPHTRSEVVNGVRIRAITKARSRLVRMIFTAFNAYRAAVQEQAQIYHLHDPELLPFGLLLKLQGATVVYDVHEDYTTSVKQRYNLPRWITSILSATIALGEPLMARPMQVVVAERYYHRRFPHSIEVLNYPLVERLQQCGEYSSPRPLHLLYTGGISEDRGALIYAQLVKHFTDLEITLVGRCSTTLVERMCAIAGEGARRLHFECTEQGVNYEYIIDAYKKQTWLAGIAIFPPTPHYIEKELTKFFEYMTVGLPIICSNFPVWKELMIESRAGLCVNPNDLYEIMNVIRFLSKNPQYAQFLSHQGRHAVRKRYQWNTQAQQLLRFYADMLAKNNK